MHDIAESPVKPHAVGARLVLPIELIVTVAFALAIFGVVAVGGRITAAIGPQAPWFIIAAAYGAPSALASVAYWLAARWYHRRRDADRALADR